MHLAIANEGTGRFPMISFRKKRLTVAIHAHFDLERADDVALVKKKIEEAMIQLENEGHAKISYSVTDV